MVQTPVDERKDWVGPKPKVCSPANDNADPAVVPEYQAQEFSKCFLLSGVRGSWKRSKGTGMSLYRSVAEPVVVHRSLNCNLPSPLSVSVYTPGLVPFDQSRWHLSGPKLHGFELNQPGERKLSDAHRGAPQTLCIPMGRQGINL